MRKFIVVLIIVIIIIGVIFSLYFLFWQEPKEPVEAPDNIFRPQVLIGEIANVNSQNLNIRVENPLAVLSPEEPRFFQYNILFNADTEILAESEVPKSEALFEQEYEEFYTALTAAEDSGQDTTLIIPPSRYELRKLVSSELKPGDLIKAYTFLVGEDYQAKKIFKERSLGFEQTAANEPATLQLELAGIIQELGENSFELKLSPEFVPIMNNQEQIRLSLSSGTEIFKKIYKSAGQIAEEQAEYTRKLDQARARDEDTLFIPAPASYIKESAQTNDLKVGQKIIINGIYDQASQNMTIERIEIIIR
jgi:hypothetical protein